MKAQRSNVDILESRLAEGVKKKERAYGSVNRDLLRQLSEKFAQQPDFSMHVCGHNRFQECDCNQLSDAENIGLEACLGVLASNLEMLRQTIQDILDDQPHQGGCIYGLHVISCICKPMRKHQPIVEAYKRTIDTFNLMVSLHLQKDSPE